MENEEVDELAKKLNLYLIRSCVKDNLNVNEPFIRLGEEALKKIGTEKKENKQETFQIDSKPQKSKSSCNI